MSWVLLSLRKSELKALHAQYVAEDLKVSREERQASRRFDYQRTVVQNDMQDELRVLRSNYKTNRENINNQIDEANTNIAEAKQYQTDIAKVNEYQKKGTLPALGTNERAEYDALLASTDAFRIKAQQMNIASPSDVITTMESQISQLQTDLEDAKEQYEYDKNFTQTKWEDELALIEDEANDTETMYEEDKVRIETQMEAVSQELQAVSQAISQQIQSETIKIS